MAAERLKRWGWLAVLGLWASVAQAQQATAPAGYYPAEYAGAMFSGVVTATDATTGKIDLLFTEGKTVERFQGVLPRGFTARGRSGAMLVVTPAIFHRGMQVTVFYFSSGKSADEIFLIKVGTTAIFNARYQGELTFMGF